MIEVAQTGEDREDHANPDFREEEEGGGRKEEEEHLSELSIERKASQVNGVSREVSARSLSGRRNSMQ